MALIPRRLSKDEREVLLLLADSASRCTQSIKMAHGFAIGMLRDLVRNGLATGWPRATPLPHTLGEVHRLDRIVGAGLFHF